MFMARSETYFSFGRAGINHLFSNTFKISGAVRSVGRIVPDSVQEMKCKEKRNNLIDRIRFCGCRIALLFGLFLEMSL